MPVTRGSTLALVGATGGAGTTRLTVEFGATLARAGRDVALFDAAFATAGLARHLPGRLDPDLTGLLTDADAALSDGLVEYPAEVPGRLSACPARAPFERLARAKTAEAAERFEALLARAAREFDHVLVDTPPVAANQAVAAVSAADRVGIVVRASERGLDALPAMGDRLHDLGAPADVVVANRASGGEPSRQRTSRYRRASGGQSGRCRSVPIRTRRSRRRSPGQSKRVWTSISTSCSRRAGCSGSTSVGERPACPICPSGR